MKKGIIRLPLKRKAIMVLLTRTMATWGSLTQGFKLHSSYHKLLHNNHPNRVTNIYNLKKAYQLET